jgi:hypothetical protein
MELLYDRGVSNRRISWFRCSDPVSSFAEYCLSWRVARFNIRLNFVEKMSAAQMMVVSKEMGAN